MASIIFTGSQAPGATYQGRVLNDQDTALFRQGLASARARDVAGTRSTLQQIGDPTARKLVEWALIDTSGETARGADLTRARLSLQVEACPVPPAEDEALRRAVLDLPAPGPNAAHMSHLREVRQRRRAIRKASGERT